MRKRPQNRLLNKARAMPDTKDEKQTLGHYTFAMPGKTRISRTIPGAHTKGCHERFVLIILLTGELVATVENIQFTLSPGLALLIFPYQPHELKETPENPAECLEISFETANFKSLAALRNAPVAMSERALSLAEWICDEYIAGIRSGTVDYNRVVMHLAFLLIELVDAAGAKSVSKENGGERKVRPSENELFQKIDYYLNRNMHDPTQVKDLAVELNMSTSHLRAVFKKHFGIGLGEHIRRKKIFHAANLLVNTNLSMKEIAIKCGFRSPYNFSRCFTRETSANPTTYRRDKRPTRRIIP